MIFFMLYLSVIQCINILLFDRWHPFLAGIDPFVCSTLFPIKPRVYAYVGVFDISAATIYKTPSRHTIVCRAAQEAGAPHREYIDRKKRHFPTFVS